MERIIGDSGDYVNGLLGSVGMKETDVILGVGLAIWPHLYVLAHRKLYVFGERDVTVGAYGDKVNVRVKERAM
jgi:hypothetical protein